MIANLPAALLATSAYLALMATLVVVSDGWRAALRLTVLGALVAAVTAALLVAGGAS